MYNEEWEKTLKSPTHSGEVALTWARQLDQSPQYLISAKTVKLPGK